MTSGINNIQKLNLGCGEFKKEGYVNLDWIKSANPDVVHDLNILPYPFEDNIFDLIEADHVLEHLEDPFGVMRELHRISKNSGEVIIRVPHFSRGFSHPEHRRGFDVTFPLYFKSTFKGGYMGAEFELKKLKLSWFAQKYLKKQTLSRPVYLIAFFFDIIFSFFANLSPVLCGRVWCFVVGGFEEIEFIFIVKKMIKLVKFCMIGGIGLAINLVIAYILKEYFGFWYFWAFLIGVLLNWTFNFLANSHITFRGHSKENYAAKYAVFLSVYLMAFAINSGFVYTMTSIFNIYYLISIIIAAAITALITFSLSRRFVYHDR